MYYFVDNWEKLCYFKDGFIDSNTIEKLSLNTKDKIMTNKWIHRTKDIKVTYEWSLKIAFAIKTKDIREIRKNL